MKYPSLKEIQNQLSAKTLTLPDLLLHYVSQIEQNKSLNAFNEVFTDSANLRAKEIQTKIDQGTAGPLAGMVIGIKDNICYKDHIVSASSKMLENFVSPYSATVVERLLQADALIIGRLNCDEFAMGGSNESSYFGAVKNAANNGRVSGGSSGGSAVAVQADMCLASLGSDTGGSVRQPAAFCGNFGLKPSYGRISRYGVIAFASSFDQIGTFTRNAADAAAILQVIAGADEFDSTVATEAVPNYALKLQAPAQQLRIAVLKETLENDALQPDIKSAINAEIASLRAEGHQVEEVSFPLLDYLVPCYYVLTMAEASSNLSRFDGLHYGYRDESAKSLNDLYKQSRAQGFGEEVKRRILMGTFVLSSGYYDAYFDKAQRMRRLIKQELESIFTTFDLVLTPTSPTVAYELAAGARDPLESYMADIYTVLASLAGNPAMSVPIGTDKQGLPIGMQLISKYFDEATLLAFSDRFIDKSYVNKG